MTLDSFQHLFKTHKELQLFGRYINSDHLLPLLKKHHKKFHIKIIGTSVLGDPIYSIIIGNGSKKIMMWSQMHGNESTTTKAVFDLCNVFSDSDDTYVKQILTKCTIAIIPMLNPDGAKAYTRLNANGIDLNRDAQNRTQPESIALRQFFDQFAPDFCFNLHGQRTIFSAGNTNNPATVSFLAPAQNEECTITETRKKAMEIIVKMTANLQAQMPNQIGIYDDSFNLNCVGDTFQSLDVPTILFEAGHYANDYDREVVRGFMFQSLLLAIHHITSDTLNGNDFEGYFKIPQNQKLFYDVIIRNASLNEVNCDIAIQFQEKLVGETIEFIPLVDKISDLKEFFGHREVDAKNSAVLTADGQDLCEGNVVDFVLLNDEKLSFKI